MMDYYDQRRYEHDVTAYGIDGTELPWADNPTVNGLEIGPEPIEDDAEEQEDK